MNKIAKSAAIVTAVLALIVALIFTGLAIYLCYGFDANRFKTQITNLVQEKKHRTLTIEGDLKFTIFPRLGVGLGKTSLSAHESDAQFARLDSAHVSLALLPLLKKELLIDRIELTGLDLTFTRDKEGKTNVDDLLTPEDQSKQPLKFDVQVIAVNNANLHFADAMNEVIGSVRNIQFKSGRILGKTPEKLQFSAQFESQKPQAKVELSLSSRLTFNLDEKSVNAENIELTTKGSFENNVFDMSLNTPKLQANATTRTLSAEGLSLSGSGITSSAKNKAASSLKLSQFKFNSGLLMLDTGENSFNLSKLSVMAKGENGGEKFETTLELPQLTINQKDAFGDSIKARLRLSGAHNVDATLNLNKITGTSQSLRIAEAALDFEYQQNQRNIRGHITSPISGSLRDREFAMNNLMANLKIEDPAMHQKSVQLPISGSLQADIRKETASAKLTAQIDDSHIDASVSLHSLTEPAITFNIAADKFNLDRYIPSIQNTTTAQPGSDATTKTAETPFDLSPLKTMTINGNLRVNALQAHHIKASDVSLTVSGNRGKFDLAPLTARLYQGTLSGAMSINANDNSFALKPQLTDVNISTLMKDAFNHDNLEGRGNVNVNLTMSGNKISLLKRSLNGSINTTLRDGAVKGINVAKSLRDFKNKIANTQNQQQAADPTEKTDFSALSASIHFTNGIGKSDDLLLKSPFLRAGGSGTLDMSNDGLDYLARINLVNSATGQDGTDLNQLKNLTIPLRISGPLDKLSYNIEFASLAGDALKAAITTKVAPKLEEKKKALGNQLTDQLKSKLNNLFGR